MLIAIGISILLVIFLTYAGMKKYVIPKMTQDYVTQQVDNAVAEKDTHIKDLNKRIANLSKQLFDSQKRYSTLKMLIEKKVNEAESIKEPRTRDEVIQRFNDLGYNPEP